MYFKIEKDHEPGSFGGHQGQSWATFDERTPKDERTYPVVLYCYDDDMNLYYTIGCSDDKAAEAAHDWARDMSGCTQSKIASPRTEPAEWFIA